MEKTVMDYLPPKEQETKNLSQMPERCFVWIDTSGIAGAVCKGEKGFHPLVGDYQKEDIQKLNEALGVTKQQVEAMKTGSAFGWHVPGADAQYYDQYVDKLERA